MKSKEVKTKTFDYHCSCCDNDVKVEEADFIPGRTDNIHSEEYLIFWAVCPECGEPGIFEECTSTDLEVIPRDMKLRIMKRFAHIADESLALARAKVAMESARRNCEYIEGVIKSRINEGLSDEELYPGWYNSSKIVRELKQRKA